jgi:hypothetical protein
MDVHTITWLLILSFFSLTLIASIILKSFNGAMFSSMLLVLVFFCGGVYITLLEGEQLSARELANGPNDYIVYQDADTICYGSHSDITVRCYDRQTNTLQCQYVRPHRQNAYNCRDGSP